MANGDMVDEIKKRGTVATTDDTDTTLVSVTIPVATDGIVAIHAWAEGQRIDTSTDAFMEELIAIGVVDAGVFTLSDFGSLGTLDISTSGYATALTAPDDTHVALRVTGVVGHNVRWHGRVTVEITAQTITGGA